MKLISDIQGGGRKNSSSDIQGGGRKKGLQPWLVIRVAPLMTFFALLIIRLSDIQGG